MKKAIYKPTNQNTIIINQVDGYCEILLDGEYKSVSIDDLTLEKEEIDYASLDALKENIFINCVKKPLSDILYSYNSNRLTPEPYQYKLKYNIFKYLVIIFTKKQVKGNR